MQPGIVISGDFSAPGSGRRTPARGSEGIGLRPSDHSFNAEEGWVTSRKTFRRVAKAPEDLRPPQFFDPDAS